MWNRNFFGKNSGENCKLVESKICNFKIFILNIELLSWKSDRLCKRAQGLLIKIGSQCEHVGTA